MAKGFKSGGRKKGTRNKDKTQAQQLCESLGVDPFQIMLYFASGNTKALKLKKDSISPGMRLAAAIEASNYVLPKRKAVEHSGDVGMTFTDFVKALEDDAGDDDIA